MIENSNHIISRLRWDTIFDDKLKASELQSRLSDWTRQDMQREITSILNRHCPPGQVWQIDRLELDLGITDYNYLEEELTVKVKRIVDGQLHELIMEQLNKGETARLHIISDYISEIGFLQSFLLQGILPWNYTGTHKPVNELLREQLEENGEAVMDMLYDIAPANKNVRRRIAWQINESNIVGIIKKMEPGNSAVIVGFANDLTSVQENETIVQAGLSEFKKNTWYWILNYLFATHGSLFNKKEFLKSSIRQMAAHYNTNYDELLALIKNLLIRKEYTESTNSGFLELLRILAKEDMNETVSAVSGDEKKTEARSVLTTYFQQQRYLQSAGDRKEFNELVIKISRQYPQWFSELIHSLGRNQPLWRHAVRNLDDVAMEIILQAWNSAAAAPVCRTIRLLITLNQSAALKIHRGFFWETGIDYLSAPGPVSGTTRNFMVHFIRLAEKIYQQPGATLLEKMITAEFPVSGEVLSIANICKDLTELYKAQVSAAATAQEVADKLINRVSGLSTGAVQYAEGEKNILLHLKYNPKLIAQALSSHPDKQQVKKILDRVLTDELARTLLPYLDSEKTALLTNSHRVLLAINNAAKDRLPASVLDRYFFATGVTEVMTASLLNQDPALFFKSFIQQLYKKIPASYIKQFSILLSLLLDADNAQTTAIPKKLKEKISNEYIPFHKDLVPLQIMRIIATSPYNQAEICRLLSVHFNTPVMEQIRRKNNGEAARIINYLLPGGEKIKQQLIELYCSKLELAKIPTTKAGLVLRLNELFWKTILQYNRYKGGLAAFNVLFKTAVLFNFPSCSRVVIDETNRKPPTPLIENVGEIQSLKKINAEELLELIGQCLSNSTELIARNGTVYKFNELASAGLNNHPLVWKAILQQLPATPSRIAMLQSSFHFSQFITAMMGELEGVVSLQAALLRSLYEYAETVMPGGLAPGLKNNCWNYSWHLIRENRVEAGSFKKMAADFFELLTKETGKDIMALLALLKTNNKSLFTLLGNIPGDKTSLNNISEPGQIKKWRAKYLFSFGRKNWFSELMHSLVFGQQVPLWFHSTIGSYTETELLNDIIAYFPAEAFRFIKAANLTALQEQRLVETMDIVALLTAMGRLNPVMKPQLDVLLAFITSLANQSWTGISSVQVQNILAGKIFHAWITGNWRSISTENSLQELLWELVMKRGLSKNKLIREIEKNKERFPVAMRQSVEKMIQQDRKNSQPVQQPVQAQLPNDIKSRIEKQLSPSPAAEGIIVLNAGLVLINSYVPMLFDRLGITETNQFIHETAQSEAVHYLQYAVTGNGATEESFLTLNKVLCGIDITQPIPPGINITAKTKQLTEGLINAFIGFWPVIGQTSVDGFRGNWLVRKGLLTELDEKWELTVEKKAYDVLLNKSPFSFSVIKFPWMKKPLHVNWAF